MSYDLPPALVKLVDAIGQTDALKLVERYGGTKLYLPSLPKPNNQIAMIIGVEQAQALAAAWDDIWLHVPRGVSISRAARDKEIRKAFDDGESVRNLALKYQLVERSIRRILSIPDPDKS